MTPEETEALAESRQDAEFWARKDVGALVERLRDGVKPSGEDEFATELYDIDDAETVMAQAADALLSAQEEAAGLRELVSDMSNSVAEVDDDRKFWKDKATRAESKLADAVGVCRKYEKAMDELFGRCVSNGVFNAWGKPANCTAINEANEANSAFLTSIKEPGNV